MSQLLKLVTGPQDRPFSHSEIQTPVNELQFEVLELLDGEHVREPLMMFINFQHYQPQPSTFSRAKSTPDGEYQLKRLRFVLDAICNTCNGTAHERTNDQPLAEELTAVTKSDFERSLTSRVNKRHALRERDDDEDDDERPKKRGRKTDERFAEPTARNSGNTFFSRKEGQLQPKFQMYLQACLRSGDLRPTVKDLDDVVGILIIVVPVDPNYTFTRAFEVQLRENFINYLYFTDNEKWRAFQIGNRGVFPPKPLPVDKMQEPAFVNFHNVSGFLNGFWKGDASATISCAASDFDVRLPENSLFYLTSTDAVSCEMQAAGVADIYFPTFTADNKLKFAVPDLVFQIKDPALCTSAVLINRIFPFTMYRFSYDIERGISSVFVDEAAKRTQELLRENRVAGALAADNADKEETVSRTGIKRLADVVAGSNGPKAAILRQRALVGDGAQVARLVEQKNSINTMILSLYKFLAHPDAEVSDALREMFRFYDVNFVQKRQPVLLDGTVLSSNILSSFNSVLARTLMQFDLILDTYNTHIFMYLAFHAAMSSFAEYEKMPLHMGILGNAGLGKSRIIDMMMLMLVEGTALRSTGSSLMSEFQPPPDKDWSNTVRFSDEGIRLIFSNARTNTMTDAEQRFQNMLKSWMSEGKVSMTRMVYNAMKTPITKLIEGFTHSSYIFASNGKKEDMLDPIAQRVMTVSANVGLVERSNASLGTYVAGQLSDSQAVNYSALSGKMRTLHFLSSQVNIFITLGLLPSIDISLFTEYEKVFTRVLNNMGFTTSDRRSVAKAKLLLQQLVISNAIYLTFGSEFSPFVTGISMNDEDQPVINRKNFELADLLQVEPYLFGYAELCIFSLFVVFGHTIDIPRFDAICVIAEYCAGMTASLLQTSVQVYDWNAYCFDHPKGYVPEFHRGKTNDMSLFYITDNNNGYTNPPRTHVVTPPPELSRQTEWQNQRILHGDRFFKISDCLDEDGLPRHDYPMVDPSQFATCTNLPFVIRNRVTPGGTVRVIDPNYIYIGCASTLKTIAESISDNIKSYVQVPVDVAALLDTLKNMTRSIHSVPFVNADENPTGSQMASMFLPSKMRDYKVSSLKLVEITNTDQVCAPMGVTVGRHSTLTVALMCTHLLLTPQKWQEACLNAISSKHTFARDVIIPASYSGQPELLDTMRLKQTDTQITIGKARVFNDSVYSSVFSDIDGIASATTFGGASVKQNASSVFVPIDVDSSIVPDEDLEEQLITAFNRRYLLDNATASRMNYPRDMYRRLNTIYGFTDEDGNVISPQTEENIAHLRMHPALAHVDDIWLSFFLDEVGRRKRACGNYPKDFGEARVAPPPSTADPSAILARVEKEAIDRARPRGRAGKFVPGNDRPSAPPAVPSGLAVRASRAMIDDEDEIMWGE